MSYTLHIIRKKEYQNVAWKGKKPENSTISEVNLIDNTTKKSMFSCFACENGGESTDASGTDRRIIAREYQAQWNFTSKSIGLPNGKYRGDTILSKYGDLVSEANRARFSWGKKNLALHLYTSDNKNFINRMILIHNGNAPQDSEACILLGYADNKNGTIGQSGQCLEDFTTLVLGIGVENLTIKIKELP